MQKISVIVPVYKVERYIEMCIESIIRQSYRNFEIILVDDGSPDRCPEICDDYGKKYSNIYVIHQENGGLSAARNAGIEWTLANSDSEWITFVDSDDWIHDKYLELLLKSVEKYNKSMSCCKFEYIKERNGVLGDISERIELRDTMDVYKDIEFDSNSACGRLYKKELWKELRFPIGKLHEDRFITHKLLFLQEEMAVADDKLYYYYMNYEGICRSQWDYRKLDNLEAIEKQLQYFREHGLELAWEYTEREYIRMLIAEMKNVAKYYKNDKKTYKYLRDKLRYQLKMYSDLLGYSFKNNINIYKYAWPIPAKCWRRICFILGKEV